MPDISNPFFSELIRGVENIAYRNGYRALVCDTENSIEKEDSYIQILIEERVDGVIITSTATENDEIRKLLNENISVVIADREIRNSPYPTIKADNLDGSYQLTKYVLRLGYSNISYVRGPDAVTTTSERYNGFKKAIEESDVNLNSSNIYEGDFTFEGGYRTVKGILERKKEIPNLIILANDLMAVGGMRAVQDKNLEVPRDIGLCGFDNIPIASLVRPKLTTFNIPASAIGQKSMEILGKAISPDLKETENNNKIVLQGELIKGESCCRQ